MEQTPHNEPPQPAIPVVDYDTPPRADHVTRRKYLGVLIAMVLLAIALGAMLLLFVARTQVARTSGATIVATPTPVRTGPTTAQIMAAVRASQRAAEQAAGQQELNQYLNFSPAPTTIVYEEEPVNAMRLHTAGGTHTAQRNQMSQPLWGSFQPPVFRPAPFDSDRDNKKALLFAHERTSPGGNTRLVILEMDVKLEAQTREQGEADVKIRRTLRYRICEPKLFVNAPRVLRHGQSLSIAQQGETASIPVRWVDGSLRASRDANHNLRIFAGQADSNDKSHFTVEYALGGKRNVIDGWLTDDDFLRIIPRGGSVEGGIWRIDADPTTEQP